MNALRKKHQHALKWSTSLLPIVQAKFSYIEIERGGGGGRNTSDMEW